MNAELLHENIKRLRINCSYFSVIRLKEKIVSIFPCNQCP